MKKPWMHYGAQLKDTIPYMISNNYKERFMAEYYQLKIRRDKLHNMIVKYAVGTLDFVPDCPLEILEKQEEIMDKYLEILEIRSQIEKVVIQ